ncbi:MAG: hypothetical protein AAGE52_41475, partial [Myxococcota bacterium]
LAPGGAFQVRPGSERGALDVVRVSSRCGASALQLRFVCPMRDAPEAVVMSVGESRETLPECTARWQVEVQPPRGRPYSLGHLAAGGETPLQSRFASGRSEALLRADWGGREGLRFAPVGDPVQWEELRAAFAAGAARIVRKAGVSARAACAGEGTPVDIAVADDGVAIDSRYLAREMTAHFGADGTRFVASAAALKAIADEFHVCLAASYGVRQGAAALSASFAQLVDTAPITQRFAGANICIAHQPLRITPEGTSPEGEASEQCVTADDAPFLIASAGSTVVVPEGTVACRGREALEGEGERFVLARGFVDVRVATNGGCRTLQTASLARIGVIDPGVDWVPVGVRRGSRGAAGESIPAWQGILVDDPRTFGHVRRRDTFRFRMTSPEGLATAWNHPSRGADTLLTRFAPTVTETSGELGHARPPLFVTQITDDADCPLASENPDLIDANDVVVDEEVFVHLIANDGRAPRCVATAAFRAREPRVLVSRGASVRRQIRFGVLGDARVGVFISDPDPGAIGALLPLLYSDLHLKHGFLFELAVPITAAIAWEDGGGSRVGAGIMAAMNWGIPDIAPRLLTVGFLIHPPWPHPDDEVWSFFFGLNVTSLIDLLGGR